MATRAYEFVQLDVFTRNRWSVNPRAVFTDTVPEDTKMVSLVQEINWVLSCHVSRSLNAFAIKSAQTLAKECQETALGNIETKKLSVRCLY
jgi:predicted PhzF superfamily epimerase YddE/YHI9